MKIQENQPRIEKVQQNDVEMEIVHRDYLPFVNEIIIVNDTEM